MTWVNAQFPKIGQQAWLQGMSVLLCSKGILRTPSKKSKHKGLCLADGFHWLHSSLILSQGSQLLKSPIRNAFRASGSHSVKVHLCSHSCLGRSITCKYPAPLPKESNYEQLCASISIFLLWIVPLKPKGLVPFSKFVDSALILSEPWPTEL